MMVRPVERGSVSVSPERSPNYLSQMSSIYMSMDTSVCCIASCVVLSESRQLSEDKHHANTLDIIK